MARAADAIAAEILALLGTGRQIAPITAAEPEFGLEDAYRVTAALTALRRARGERPIGRKLGFTNRTIWAEYGVFAPIWGPVYDTTVSDLDAAGTLALDGLAEPRIEPEIVFGLAAAPRPGMDAAALLACIGWVAHGFELVQSLFPAWRFAAADTVAAMGLHGKLVIGPRHPVADDPDGWRDALERFTIELLCDGAVMDRGRAANVLDGPLHALAHLVSLLAEDPINPPLAAGEIVTTGTLTRAMPVRPGETWSTRLTGIPLGGLTLRLA